MLTCKQFDDFMVDYLEGALPLWQKIRCWLHVTMCRECAHFVRQYRKAVALGRDAFEDPDAELPKAVPEELVRAALSHRKTR